MSEQSSQPPRAARRALARLISPFRRFRRNKDGAVALEFGLIAIPFIGLIFAIMETCLVFLTGQALETATTDASRLILTGQAQSGNFTAQQFKDRICQRFSAMVNCQGSVYVDVRSFGSFTGATMPATPIDNNGNMITNGTQFTPGAAKQIVIVRAYLAYQVYTSVFGQSLANLPGNKRLIMATVAFQNEPYTN
jgi:Flp pilus assembly protein TadG